MDTETQLLDLTLATTAELVIAAQAGDNEAFGELVSRFERMVQAVCYQRLRNHAEAQEAAQEVFIKALQKLDQLEEPAAFAGWL
jgi:RNA polymerase sigma-70 factor (ECF subfamily)